MKNMTSSNSVYRMGLLSLAAGAYYAFLCFRRSKTKSPNLFTSPMQTPPSDALVKLPAARIIHLAAAGASTLKETLAQLRFILFAAKIRQSPELKQKLLEDDLRRRYRLRLERRFAHEKAGASPRSSKAQSDCGLDDRRRDVRFADEDISRHCTPEAPARSQSVQSKALRGPDPLRSSL